MFKYRRNRVLALCAGERRLLVKALLSFRNKLVFLCRTKLHRRTRKPQNKVDRNRVCGQRQQETRRGVLTGAAAQFPGRCADYRKRSFCRLHGTVAYGNKEFRGGDNFRLILQYGQKSNRAVFQRTADCIAGAVGKTHPGFLPEGTGTCERVLGYSLSRKHPQGVEVCCQARPNLQ